MLPFFKQEQKELSEAYSWLITQWEKFTLGNIFFLFWKGLKYLIVISVYIAVLIFVLATASLMGGG